MKHFIAIVLFCFVTTTQAGDIFNKNQKWPMKSGEVTVKVIPVDNVQASCEKESKRRGQGGFGFGVQACTFWQGSSCTIIVAKQEIHHTLGHEFYHCFAGGFH